MQLDFKNALLLTVLAVVGYLWYTGELHALEANLSGLIDRFAGKSAKSLPP